MVMTPVLSFSQAMGQQKEDKFALGGRGARHMHEWSVSELVVGLPQPPPHTLGSQGAGSLLGWVGSHFSFSDLDLEFSRAKGKGVPSSGKYKPDVPKEKES